MPIYGQSMTVFRTSLCVPVSPAVNVLLVSVVIAPANPKRIGFMLYNNSANSTYVTFGPTAVAASCTQIVATFASWPFFYPVCYTGPISAIRNAGSGVCTVYELLSD